MRCDFSGWVIRDNTLVQEFTYSGEGPPITLQLEIALSKGTFSTHKLFFFHLKPANGFEGGGQLKLTDRETGRSPGWIDCRMVTAASGSTLINVLKRADADDLFQILCSISEQDLELRRDREVIAKLPLPITASLRPFFDKLRVRL